MPVVKKQVDSEDGTPGPFDLHRLSTPVLAILMTLIGVIALLCTAHITGHLEMILGGDDSVSDWVGLIFGMLIEARCASIIFARAMTAKAH
jgi:hypothetical protein